MTRTLARNLYHMLRGAAKKTTLDGLKKRGHRTVSVLNFRDIQQLIGRAIENTLQRRGLSLDSMDIQDEVRHEFISLMRERDALQNTVDALLREKDELAENRTALASELTKATEEFENAQETVEGVVPKDIAELMRRITAEVTDTQNAAGVNSQLTAKTLSLVQAALEDHADMLNRHAQAAQATNLQHLQRRISKLKRKLEETEDMLERARATGVEPEGVAGEPIDPGVKHGDPDFRMKKELLGEIFRLNVELRQMLNKN
jgi:chromosome segregation ATPase